MAKKKEFPIIASFKIFINAFNLYFKHIDKFLKYMTYPVMGQVLGIFMIFGAVHFITNNVYQWLETTPLLNNISLVFLLVILSIVPGFIIFLTAFWKFLVAYGSLNSMANNIISNAKFQDVNIHNDIITRRSKDFIILLLIMSLVSSVLVFPPFWLLAVFMALIFQVFALEENLNLNNVLIRAVSLVKTGYLKTLILMVYLMIFTYFFMPKVICFLFEKLNLIHYFALPINAFCSDLPIEETASFIAEIIPSFSFDINSFVITLTTNIISVIVVSYLLPLRSIACTILYKELDKQQLKEKKIKDL